MSARSKDAEHLVESGIEVAEITATEGACDAIKRVVLKRHLLGIAVDERGLGREAEVVDLLLPDSHHLTREVKACDALCLASAEHFDSEVGSTDCYVKDMLGDRHQAYRTAAPEAVDAEREAVIESIVGGCDAVKELPYVLFLLHVDC